MTTTLKVSTGLRNQLLDSGNLKAALAGGLLLIYGGAEPVSADDAATGTLLCTISAGGTGAGLNLGAAAGGSIPKAPAQTWSGINVASGTATHFRYVAAGDTGIASTTALRLQGNVGTEDAALLLSAVNLVNGAPQVIDAVTLTLPASA